MTATSTAGAATATTSTPTTSTPATPQSVRTAYLVHQQELLRWTRSLVGDRQLAEDLVTEAFARLMVHWDTVRNPRPWLYATVAHLVRDHWRKRGRESAAYARLQREVGGGAAAPDPAPDHADLLWVRGAVERLPERLRVAVLLHYFVDLPVAQVAARLAKSEGAVKRDLHDARILLALQMHGIR